MSEIQSDVALVKSLSLRTNFSWTLTGSVIYNACQWGMLVVLAKLGSPVLVGQFALGLAITAPIIMFANLQLRAVQATDAKHEFRFNDYLGLRLLMLLFSLFVIVTVAILSGYRYETVLVISAIGIAKIFESISDVIFGLMQHYERMDKIAVSMMIKGPLSLLALGAGVYLTGSVFWGSVGLAIAWALILMTFDVRNGLSIIRATPSVNGNSDNTASGFTLMTPRWDKATLAKLALLSLPLGLVMLLISLNVNIPRYFIEHYLGERSLGIFAAMSYIMVAGTTVINSLGQSASPRLAKYYAAGESDTFQKLLAKLIGIALLIGIIAYLVTIFAGEAILALLYRPEYAKHIDVFVLIVIASGIGYVASFFGFAITAARCFKAQLPLFATVIIALVAACAWLIPKHGLTGAAIALIIAAVVQVVGSIAVLLPLLRRNRHSGGGIACERQVAYEQ